MLVKSKQNKGAWISGNELDSLCYPEKIARSFPPDILRFCFSTNVNDGWLSAQRTKSPRLSGKVPVP